MWFPLCNWTIPTSQITVQTTDPLSPFELLPPHLHFPVTKLTCILSPSWTRFRLQFHQVWPMNNVFLPATFVLPVAPLLTASHTSIPIPIFFYNGTRTQSSSSQNPTVFLTPFTSINILFHHLCLIVFTAQMKLPSHCSKLLAPQHTVHPKQFEPLSIHSPTIPRRFVNLALPLP